MKLSRLLTACIAVPTALLAQMSGTALVRHAPSLNSGMVDGSVQQMSPESVTLNGGAVITGDLLVPGLPPVRVNGNPSYGGTRDGTGGTIPSNYQVTLNGSVSLRNVVRRTDAVALPAVGAPPAPTSARNVTITASSQSTGDFATLRNLTLSGSVGQFAVPSGTYGDFTANDGSGFTLGIAGSTQPSVYNFQRLTLNGQARIEVLGPVIVNLAHGFAANGTLGSSAKPAWLALNIHSGPFTLNGGCDVFGFVTAPNSTVTLNGNSELIGGLVSDRLTINGGGLLRLASAANAPPTVSLTAPASGAVFSAPGTILLRADAADADGSVTRVQFFAGNTLLGETTAAPHQFTWTNVPAGTYSITAKATDNESASSTSAGVTVIVNAKPVVAITAPVNNAKFDTPATITVAASASDADGTISKVEFFSGPTPIGEATSAPFQITWANPPTGAHTLTAKATDNLELSKTSAPIAILVNAPPVVRLTAPADKAQFPNPASFNLVAEATDSDGAITKVEFFRGTALLGEVTAAPYEFAVTGLGPGTHTFAAKATDNVGSTAISASISVIINTPPVAAGQSVQTPEDTPLPLTLSASDVDNHPLTFAIVDLPRHGTLGNITRTSATTATVLYTPATNYQGGDSFTFKARDTVDSNTATVAITITPVEDALLVNAGLDQAITLPAFATVSGTITDPDGGTPTVLWSLASGPAAVVFEQPMAATTRVAFTAPGSYTLRLTATIGTRTASDDVVVTVDASNLAFRTYTTSADFALGVNSNINTAVADQLQLNADASAGHVFWVANSSKGTVVKINTRTGKIEGEYRTAPAGQPLNPSRTTVDLRGGVWCSNRDGNSVVHIGSVESGLWIDKNGNGQPDTSIGLGDLRGWSNAGGVDSNGGVSTAEDECIIHYVRVSSGGTRHLSIDRDNNVWVSGNAGPAARTFNLLDGRTGAILRTEGPVGHGGYGGLLDRNGTIWSTSSGTLLQWNTSQPLGGPQGHDWALADGAGHLYGLALAPDGYVWCSTIGAGLVHKYAPNGQLVASYNQGHIDAQGVAIDRQGHVWLAHTRTQSTIGHLRPDGTFVGKVTVGPGPTGVSVDADGKIWSTNHNDGTVSRIDPNAGPIGADGVTRVGAVDYTSPPLGGQLYNYSDMTGSNLIAPPLTGVWTVTFDSGKTGTAWGSINWHALIFDDSALSITVSSSADGVTFSPWRVGIRGVDLDVPDGRYLKINVLMQRSTTGHSPVVHDLTAGEQGYLLDYPFNQPPVIEAAAVQAANFGVEAKLQAKVGDDGLPHPTRLTYTWSKVSGPGAVSFNSATRADATATFSQTGNYVLRLTATDGAATTTKDVTVVANTPPTAFAGPDLGARVAGATLAFRGSVFEDANNNGGLQVQWRQVAGPATATIAHVTSPTSAVTLPAVGRYLFELKADDGLAPPSIDLMQIRVGPLASPDLPFDMAAWWTFDGTTADVVHQHIAQLRNGAALANGHVAQAAIFNGITSHGVAPAHADLDIGTSPSGFSIEFWMKPDEFRDTSMVEWESMVCVWQLGGAARCM